MKKNTCFVMLAALMMAGCNNEIDEQVMDSRRVPLQINGDINMLMTRAADDHWDKMVHLFLLMKTIPLVFRKMVLL